MSVNLNLLPPELSVSRDLGNLLKTLRSLGVIAAVTFLVAAGGMAAYFTVEKLTLNNLDAKVSVLKTQVAAQEKSEQQIVLLRDRLGKIASIQNLPASLTNLNSLETLLTGLSVGTTVNQMQVDAVGAGLSLGIKTNPDLTAFLTSIRSSNNFKSVGLASFNFNPTVGYSLEVQMTK